MIALTLGLLLAQTETPIPPPTETEQAPPGKTPEQQEAEDRKRIADAAQRLAAAAERLFPTAKPGPKEEPPPKLWSGSISLGLTWLTGNVGSLSFLTTGGITRKSERTIFAVKAFGAYGETVSTMGGLNEVLLYNAGGAAQFDYRFNSTISLFVGGGLDTDHVKSVEIRGYGEVGVGITWYDAKEGDLQKALVKTDVSLRAQPESRFQYYPTEQQLDDAFLLGPRLAAIGHYAVSKAVYVHEEIEFMPNVLHLRFLVNSTTKVAATLVASVALTGAFTFKYDSAPADGKKPVDTILTVGAEASF